MRVDLHTNLIAKTGIAPVSGAADNTVQTSATIDTQGYDALEFLIATGSIADADATFAVEVYHGDASNMSDEAAVPDNQLLGLESGAGFQFDSDNQVRKIGYRGTKRYVRVKITPANNTGAWLIACVAVLGAAVYAPATQPTA